MMTPKQKRPHFLCLIQTGRATYVEAQLLGSPVWSSFKGLASSLASRHRPISCLDIISRLPLLWCKMQIGGSKGFKIYSGTCRWYTRLLGRTESTITNSKNGYGLHCLGLTGLLIKGTFVATIAIFPLSAGEVGLSFSDCQSHQFLYVL